MPKQPRARKGHSDNAQLAVSYVPLDSLKPYELNARTHPRSQLDKLKASMRRLGWGAPMLTADGTILAGHARHAVAQELRAEGITIRGTPSADMAPTVDLSHLSPAERRAYILADNRIALDGGWDLDLLKSEFDALKGMDFDLDLTGFDAGEIINYSLPRETGETNPADEWVGMPEYEQEDIQSFRRIIVHFRNAEDVSDFFRRMEQPETKKRLYIWHPAEPRNVFKDKAYVTDEPAAGQQQGAPVDA